MDYETLVEVYERLESTSSKLKKTEILADFFKKTPAELLPKIVLLVQGIVFPKFTQLELGIATQMMIRAIARSCGFSTEQIEQNFKKTGDLGLTAEELVKKKKQATLIKKKLTVEHVFDSLQKLPYITGEGSQEKKLNLISELITSANPKEARYIVRTILGEMRTGAAEGIIRDAIANAFLLTGKESKEEKAEILSAVDYAYNLVSDFGEVAKTAKEKGVDGLRKVKVKLGKPIQVMLGLAAEKIEDVIKEFGKVAAEYKYDGMRCITGHTPIYVKDKGLLSVKDVKVGDEVLTHSGTFKKVLAKMKRKKRKGERVFKFSTFLGNEFKITEGHEILVHSGGKLVWLPVEKVTKNMEVVFPIPKIGSKPVPKKLVLSTLDGYKKEFALNENFFRFLGFWIGDGYTNNYNKTFRIGLLFNRATEQKLVKTYKNIVQNEFGITGISNYNFRGATDLHWTDRPLLLWLSHNFRHARRGWKGKTLPEWFFGLDKKRFVAFLKGWIEADGSVDELGNISVITKERTLAMHAQLLALKHKIILGVKKLRIGEGTYYKIISPRTQRYCRIVGDKVFVKILKLEEIRYPDPQLTFYNLQVEGEQSYCTTMAALHNCQIHKNGNEIWIFTRRLEDVTKQFPDIVELCKKGLKAEECIVEGEAIGINPKTNEPVPFQNLSQRIQRKYDIEKMVKEIPVQVNLFDVVYVNGELLIGKKFEERRKILEKIVKPLPEKFQLAKQIVSDDPKEIEKFYKEALKEKQEGIFLKVLTSPYVFGRHVGGWYKIKPVMETLDLVVIGATWGEGARAKWITSYVLGARDPSTGKFLECGMMSTGLTEEEYKTMTKILKPLIISEKGKNIVVKPKIVLEVAYQEIQKSPTYASGFALRFPRFVRIRNDKGPEEADTIQRVKDLFMSQGKVG
jgi:ATP-dependent DNA ligase